MYDNPQILNKNIFIVQTKFFTLYIQKIEGCAESCADQPIRAVWFGSALLTIQHFYNVRHISRLAYDVQILAQ